MVPRVLVIGTLDTKRPEVDFVADKLKGLGCEPIIMDCGVLQPSPQEADIPNHQVAAAGGTTLSHLQQAADRGLAVIAMGDGAAKLTRKAFEAGQVAGVLGLGGSGGSFIAGKAMQALPLGVPKLLVSTVSSGIRSYVGTKDVMVMHAVVDLAGLNSISRVVLTNAAVALGHMARTFVQIHSPGKPWGIVGQGERKRVAVTMFGVTTPGVQAARHKLEELGYEAIVFHANGAGGRTMEELVRDGMFVGVLDMTTTEMADEVVGGFLSAGPHRLRYIGELGIPHLIVPGAIDMVNFGDPTTVPSEFRNRLLHRHNPEVTLMRTSPEENRQLGEIFGLVLDEESTGPRRCLIPALGFSALDRQGHPFYDPQANHAFKAGLFANVSNATLVEEVDLHINDTSFGELAAEGLHALIHEAHNRAVG